MTKLKYNKNIIKSEFEKAKFNLDDRKKRMLSLYERLNLEESIIIKCIVDDISKDSRITIDKNYSNQYYIKYNDEEILTLFVRSFLVNEKDSIRFNINHIQIRDIKYYNKKLEIIYDIFNKLDIDKYNDKIYKNRERYNKYVKCLEIDKVQTEFDKWNLLLDKITENHKFAPSSIYIEPEFCRNSIYYFYDGKTRSFSKRWRNSDINKYCTIKAIKILSLTEKNVNFRLYSDKECNHEITNNHNKKGYYTKNKKYIMSIIEKMEPDKNTVRRMKLDRLIED